MPVVAPSARGGSSLMKSCQPCVGMPKPTAVYALSWATCTLSSAAPSIRLNAFSTPPSSTTAMTIGVPISLALASAPAMIRCAASVLMLAFGNVSAMSPPPPLEPERRRAYRPAAQRLEGQAQQRLGVGGADVEVPVGVVDRQPVEV